MDYEAIAREIVIEMIKNSANGNRIGTEPFSSGEMRLLGCLLLVKDGMTAGELCQTINVTTPRIAQMLNTLEKKGNLLRRAESEDKRIINVYLTEQGREFSQKRYDSFVAFITRLYEELGEDEMKAYLRLSKRIREIAHEMDLEIK